MNIAIVVPAYNESKNIKITIEELFSILEKISAVDKFKIVVVDDHSADNTYETVCQINDPRIACLRLSRRSGSHTALRAGLLETNSDAVLCISADGQDNPVVIENMLLKWSEGNSVIWALREKREHELWYIRKLTEVFYQLLFWFVDTRDNNIDLARADFFLLDKDVVQAINTCPERNTSLLGLIVWLGFKQDFVQYQRRLRRSGSSKWNLRSRWLLAKDWIVAFSGLPLRMASTIGILIALLGILGTIYVVLDKLFFSNIVPGWTSIVALILFLSGIQLTILGITGEYLWQNLDETRKRPLFFIEKKWNGAPPG